MIEFNPCRFCSDQPVVTKAPMVGFVLVQCGNSKCTSRGVARIIKAPVHAPADEWNQGNPIQRPVENPKPKKHPTRTLPNGQINWEIVSASYLGRKTKVERLIDRLKSKGYEVDHHENTDTGHEKISVFFKTDMLFCEFEKDSKGNWVVSSNEPLCLEKIGFLKQCLTSLNRGQP